MIVRVHCRCCDTYPEFDADPNSSRVYGCPRGKAYAIDNCDSWRITVGLPPSSVVTVQRLPNAARNEPSDHLEFV